MTVHDDIDAGIAALHASDNGLSVCFAPECEGRAVAGTYPPACRKHGGLGVVAKAAAALRLEATRAIVQEKLHPAVVAAVDLYMRMISGDGPWVPGTMVERTVLTRTGNEVTIQDGVQRTAKDMLMASDRLLALAGFTPEMTAVNGGAATTDQLESGPVAQLQRLLASAPDERLERLVARLAPQAIEARESAHQN